MPTATLIAMARFICSYNDKNTTIKTKMHFLTSNVSFHGCSMNEYAFPTKFLEDTSYHSFNFTCIKHSERLYPIILVLMTITKVPA